MRIFQKKVGSEIILRCMLSAALFVALPSSVLAQASKPEFKQSINGTIYQLQYRNGTYGYYSQAGTFGFPEALLPVSGSDRERARKQFPTPLNVSVPDNKPSVASAQAVQKGAPPSTAPASWTNSDRDQLVRARESGDSGAVERLEKQRETYNKQHGYLKNHDSVLGGTDRGIASTSASTGPASWTNSDRDQLVRARESGDSEAVARLEKQRETYNKQNGYLKNHDSVLGGTDSGSQNSRTGPTVTSNQGDRSGNPADTQQKSGQLAASDQGKDQSSTPPEPSAREQALSDTQSRLGALESDQGRKDLSRAEGQLNDAKKDFQQASQDHRSAARERDRYLKTGEPTDPTNPDSPKVVNLEKKERLDQRVAAAEEKMNAAQETVSDREQNLKSYQDPDSVKAQRDHSMYAADKARLGGMSDKDYEKSVDRTLGKLDASKGYEKITDKVSAKSQDRCAYGATVDGDKYGCDGTETIVEGAKIFNQTTQVLGSAATQVMGQSATQGAARENTQAGYLEAGAKVQENTGKMQVGLGAINALSGVYQLMKGSQHKKSAKELKSAATGDVVIERSVTGIDDLANGGQSSGESGYVTSSNAESQKFITAFDLNKKGELIQEYNLVTRNDETAKQLAIDKRRQGERSKVNHVGELMLEAGNNAANEQAAIGKEANAGGVNSLMTGAGQLIQGAAAIASAKELKKAANTMRQPVGGSNFAMPNFGANPGGKIEGGAGGTVITGNGNAAQAEQNAAEEEAQDDAPTLGEGFLPNAPPRGVSGPPVAPRLADGSGGGSVSGSGAVGVGGGGTGAGEEGAGDAPKAEYAANLRDAGSQFASGGGGYVGGGGGGGGEGGGPDLSGMLEKLLGKNGETEFRGKPSLDEFGRAPASEPYSFLDKSVNIFDRIHKAYQAKSKSGRVGI